MMHPSDSEPTSPVAFASPNPRKQLSLGESLEILDDGQLEGFLKVVAEDMRMKHELRVGIKQKEGECQALDRCCPNRLNSCAFCAEKFGVWRRSVDCSKCSRKVCRHCQEKALCKLCLELGKLQYKRQELSILCPYARNCFGYCKYICEPDPDKVDWCLRAKLELHLMHELEDQLDGARLCFTVTDTSLENVRMRLAFVMRGFEQASHFAHIDDALSEIKKIVRVRSSCIVENDFPVDVSEGYFGILSKAVLHTIVAHSGSVTRRIPLRALNRSRPMFPRLSESDLDSSAPPQPLRLTSNWFLKPRFSSPRGSMRSQCASHLINSIVTPFLFRYGSEVAEDDDSGYQCAGEIADDSDDNEPKETSHHDARTHLKLRLAQKKLTATSGQILCLQCEIETDHPERVDIFWYNHRKQLLDGGRTLIYRTSTHSTLEIFDCDASEDNGQVVCVAIGDCEVVTSAAVVKIKEEDIAGDEPLFDFPLASISTTYNEGELLELRCKAVGYPQPYLSFFLNNRLIHVDERHRISHVNDTWTLAISNVTAANEGVYTAVATNRLGKAKCKLRIRVRRQQTGEVHSVESMKQFV